MRSALDFRPNQRQQQDLFKSSTKQDKLLDLLQRHNIQIIEEDEAATAKHAWDIICKAGYRDRILRQFSTFKTLGLGNTYARGFWDCERVDLLFERMFELDVQGKSNSILFELPNSLPLIIEQLSYRLFNISLIKQYDVAHKHYDLPAQLYEGFLGRTMKYTSGDWQDLEVIPENLDLAQQQNLDYWIQQLRIKDGDIILDCGCGWGTFPQFLKDRFDVTYIGITISQTQVDYCKAKFNSVEKFHFYNHSYHDDYQNLLASVGVDYITQCIFLETIEHGGTRNWPNILKNVRRIISQDGRLGVQVNGSEHPVLVSDPYINRYIFPHLALGSPSELGKALEHDRQFIKCNENNISEYYAPVWKFWNTLFQRNWREIEPHIQNILEHSPFQSTTEWKRHWEFYLLLVSGAYRAGTYPQLYQLTAKPNFFAR